MAKQLFEGNKVEIVEYMKDDTKHVYYSAITNIVDSTTFEMQAPIEKGIVLPLEIGKEYECIFVSDGGVYRCKASLESRFHEQNLSFLRFRVNTKIVKFQRREFFRLDTSFEFRYFNEESEEWKDARSLDISGNGIRAIVSENIPKGNKILCELTLNIKDKQYIARSQAEVNQTIPFNVSDHKFETRWVFVDIPKKDQDIIVKYIYEEQRKRRKRESGM